MGTTTFYLKYNDLGKKLSEMSKQELENLDNLLYEKQDLVPGWRAPYELHNGNVYILVFWKGRLMLLEEAPELLDKKYWDKYRGKTHNLYEWTLLKRKLLNDVAYLDKGFKKHLARKKKDKK